MDLQNNIVPGRSKLTTAIRRFANGIRSWFMLSVRYPKVNWGGVFSLVRIPYSTKIWSPHKDVTIGERVQFGQCCRIQCDIKFGNSILMASNVAFVGKDDHITSIPGTTIWNSGRGDSQKTYVGNDVWIGHGGTLHYCWWKSCSIYKKKIQYGSGKTKTSPDVEKTLPIMDRVVCMFAVTFRMGANIEKG